MNTLFSFLRTTKTKKEKKGSYKKEEAFVKAGREQFKTLINLGLGVPIAHL